MQQPTVQLDSVQIGVQDVTPAARAYHVLLGVAPFLLPSGVARFQLQRGAVELEVAEPGLRSLHFVAARGAAVPDDFNGLVVRVAGPGDVHTPAFDPAAAVAIDHVVIHSPNLDRAIALWRDKLGQRLALDREFPARGLRMLFFRSSGITLEFVSTIDAPADANGPDRFYGLAYRVRDLTACRDRLLESSLDVSDIRSGNKRGTTVATVRSGTEGVPTLLVQDPSREAQAPLSREME